MSSAVHPLCGASIFWANSQKGRRMMMDATPTPERGTGGPKTYRLEDVPGENPSASHVHPHDRWMSKTPLYTGHLETCKGKRAEAAP